LNEKTIPVNINVFPIWSEDLYFGAILILRELFKPSKITNPKTSNFARYTFQNIITRNDDMLNIINTMREICPLDCNILLEGESGVGKELFAHSIHSASNRSKGPFVAINCASLPPSLVESELFGYEKGTFTGALNQGNAGKFELANTGTIFLDEIGELPIEIQSKMLRILDTHRILRLGSNTERELDIRVIVATNRNLEEEVAKGNFRGDLYYRINVIKFVIPPLRRRQDDIPLLADEFVRIENKKNVLQTGPKNLAPEVYSYLCSYPWPGNIRELQNIIIRTYYFCKTKIIGKQDLPDFILKTMPDIKDETLTAVQPRCIPVNNAVKLLSVKELERKRIEEAILKVGSIRHAGELLGISRSTIYRKAKAYGLTRYIKLKQPEE
jgi:transcriptional regulator with PAS, ATPase and Fis domain